VNEFDSRYFPLKRKFPNRVKNFSRSRELRLERVKFPGFLLEAARVALPSPVRSMAGKRLVFISDWHWHASQRNYRILDELSGILQQFPADLLLLGGDLCDDAEFLGVLPPLLTRLGTLAPRVVAVNGNWETGKRWLKPDYFTTLFAAHGIKLLTNQAEHYADTFILGLPDISSIDFRNLPPPEITPETLNILLSHSPDGVVAADKGAFLKNFHLAFCGHNHGGQIRLPFIGALYCPSFYRCKFDRGIFDRAGSDFKMIISSGIGEHYRTGRILCPPEAVIVELA